jgi:polysaccharide pyruvyl transferase WcaK-like protein
MMDSLLELWVAGLVELSKIRWILGAGQAWNPGSPLRFLFAGYNGNRNTGADVRVEEMIRQVRRVLGDEYINLSVLSHNLQLSEGYFPTVRQVKLPDVFPPFLYREIPHYHGVIACEGSMFKSKFANALTAMMIGSLGIATAENKVSIGYGAEAGAMDRLLRSMCRRYCASSLVVTRNEESQKVLGGLGIQTELGTDTAWTFEPHGLDYGRQVLLDAGWDGQTPVLGLCPINPFWWPVKPSILKLLMNKTAGFYRGSHYRSIYFHKDGREVNASFFRYLGAFAAGVEAFRDEQTVFPVLIGMEALDRRACEIMGQALGGVPLFISDQYDMYQLVSILRTCHLLVSSRYHGIVTSMPTLVASAGVTMDERICNLMRERGQTDLLLEVDDPDLSSKLVIVLRKLLKNSEEIRYGIGKTVVRNLKGMARMGIYLQQNVKERYPEFPVRTGHYSWEDYLPPLSPGLLKLIEEFE